MIHLDTSFLIRALVRGSSEDSRLRQYLAAGEQLGVSSLSWAEFLCGPVGAREVELVVRVVQEPTPFGAEEAALAAELFNLAGRRGGSLGDCMIAATAIRAEASLASSNPADFRKLEKAGLKLALA
jgi:predicted nucleic acid-binding protein